ncbi:methionyl aminopeptidase [Gordonibacter sp.]|uniref:methionyl aminopeptidase n=1 Tax=Gordonibacter sp. TaxID=1968902 RepID=UPI002FC720AF
MYDGEAQPARNDGCWCGSGKKYKKCHLSFDERLQALADQGLEVPSRSLLKSAADIEGIKRSAAVNVGALDYVAERIGPDTTTGEIDRWVHDYTVERGAIPAPLDYEGFPKSVCTSVNEVVCHGIPSDDEVLCEGDIVNVDCSTILDGYYSDSSRMFCIGEVDAERERLVQVTKESVEAGLAQVKPWGFVGDVGQAAREVAERAGYSVVREFGGHGIGLDFHEDPFVSFAANAGEGMVLVPGLVFTIEPMVNAGQPDIDMSDSNGWTVRTADGSLTAQWEIQVAVTEDGCEVLCW